MEGISPLQGGNSDPSSILSSGTNYGKYVTFDETVETNILEFFKELA